MTPFQHFRIWARRASAGERGAAAIAAILALGALVWLVIPSGASHPAGVGTYSGAGVGTAGPSGTSPAGPSGGSGGAAGAVTGQGGTASGGPAGSGPAAAGAGSGGAGSPVAAPAGGGAGPGSATAGATPQATGTGGGAPGANQTTGTKAGCVSPSGTDQGVTAGEIKVAVTLTNIAGPTANSALGLPSAQEQQEDYQQVMDAINSSGGVACRKLVPVYFTANPADQSNLQQTCLDVAQAGVFAEFDSDSYYAAPALASCFPKSHLPFFGTAYFPKDQQHSEYPYLFGQGLLEILYHNYVMAAKQLGYFGPSDGFQKLGFLYQDCEPQVISEVSGWLHQVLQPSQIVTYDLGCPNGALNPSQDESAVLKFEQNGVTTVTEVQAEGDLTTFTTFAQQQGFHPKYRMPQDGFIYIAYGAQRPDSDNIANAIAITADRLGEERTSGFVPSGGTARCNAIFAAVHRPPVYQQPLGFGGQVCDELWMFKAAVESAPTLQRSALGAGLHAAKPVDFSYPWGPSDFSVPEVTYGGEYWRVDQFFTSCDCWRVIDRTFHPSFAGF